jgi:hypothetical protein
LYCKNSAPYQLRHPDTVYGETLHFSRFSQRLVRPFRAFSATFFARPSLRGSWGTCTMSRRPKKPTGKGTNSLGMEGTKGCVAHEIHHKQPRKKYRRPRTTSTKLYSSWQGRRTLVGVLGAHGDSKWAAPKCRILDMTRTMDSSISFLGHHSSTPRRFSRLRLRVGVVQALENHIPASGQGAHVFKILKTLKMPIFVDPLLINQASTFQSRENHRKIGDSRKCPHHKPLA